MNLIDPRRVRDLTPLVRDPVGGGPLIMPADFYRTTTVTERAMLGALNAWYGLPTQELVAWLRFVIDGRSAIEIGAGHGALAKALGIVATDNYLQQDQSISDLYQLCGQKPVEYGAHVQRLDALAAIEAHRPQVVIASWVTHKYLPERHEAGGNMFGVDEEAVIDGCETYIFIGNRKVHAGKSIWSLPHQVAEPDFLFSRAVNGSPDFIAVWSKS